jgi:hypothetical protein
VADPFADRDQLDAALEFALTASQRYLNRIREEQVLHPEVEAVIERWADPMPEEGGGTLVALRELDDRAQDAATRSSGPRFFHFVMGGGTPALLQGGTARPRRGATQRVQPREATSTC